MQQYGSCFESAVGNSSKSSELYTCTYSLDSCEIFLDFGVHLHQNLEKYIKLV